MKKLPRIFIGSSQESLRAARGIKANFENEEIEVRIWNEILEPGRYQLDELIRFTRSFDFAIFVWEGVDEVIIREQKYFSPRDNVILEAGMFYSALGRERVFLFVPSPTKADSKSNRMATDLLGLIVLYYKEPTDNNFEGATNTGCLKVIDQIIKMWNNIDTNKTTLDTAHAIKVYKNMEVAQANIIKTAQEAKTIKILANKGPDLFGVDSSIISLADASKYQGLEQIKIILLSPKSTYLNRGFMALRRYETLEDFKSELSANHLLVEAGLLSFLKNLKVIKSGIKYQLGEPYFRMIMTDKRVFVSSYAEKPTTQVRDLPVYEFENGYGSIYGALKKHFDDLWKNNSENGSYLLKSVEFEVSAGGILVHKVKDEFYVALVQRDVDGSWILPKGHKLKREKTIEETALREVKEELGISEEKLRIIRKVDSYSFDEVAKSFGSNKIVHFFLMEYLSEELPILKTDSDHFTAQWWNLKEQLPFMFYSYQKILLSETIISEFEIKIDIDERK